MNFKLMKTLILLLSREQSNFTLRIA